jgi:hypothetical protein
MCWSCWAAFASNPRLSTTAIQTASAPPCWGRFFGARRSNGDLGGGMHLRFMDMTAFGASHGPVLEAGAGRRNALDGRTTLASRAAG